MFQPHSSVLPGKSEVITASASTPSMNFSQLWQPAAPSSSSSSRPSAGDSSLSCSTADDLDDYYGNASSANTCPSLKSEFNEARQLILARKARLSCNDPLSLRRQANILEQLVKALQEDEVEIAALEAKIRRKQNQQQRQTRYALPLPLPLHPFSSFLPAISATPALVPDFSFARLFSCSEIPRAVLSPSLALLDANALFMNLPMFNDLNRLEAAKGRLNVSAFYPPMCLPALQQTVLSLFQGETLSVQVLLCPKASTDPTNHVVLRLSLMVFPSFDNLSTTVSHFNLVATHCTAEIVNAGLLAARVGLPLSDSASAGFDYFVISHTQSSAGSPSLSSAHLLSSTNTISRQYATNLAQPLSAPLSVFEPTTTRPPTILEEEAFHAESDFDATAAPLFPPSPQRSPVQSSSSLWDMAARPKYSRFDSDTRSASCYELFPARLGGGGHMTPDLFGF